MIQAYASPAALRGGDHAYAITHSDADLAWLARSFVENAEVVGARALYLTESPPDDIRRLGLRRAEHPGGVVVVEAVPVLAPGETFKPEIYIRALEAAVDAALQDGFTGVRVFVETAWSLRDIRGIEAWWRLEEIAHDLTVLRRGETALLCQFDHDRFAPEVLERVMQVHPVSAASSSAGFPASAPMRVRRDGDVLYVAGELDRGTASLLSTACRGSVGTVTIDLAEATFFDAGAYRTITRIARTCKRVRLRNAPAIVQRVVFALSGEAGLEIEVEEDALSMSVS